MEHNSLVEISLSSSINDEFYDAVIVVSSSLEELTSQDKLKPLLEQLRLYASVHSGIDSGKAHILYHSNIPSKRLIYSSTGKLDGDFDDVSAYLEAGKKGMQQ
jgi:hypothetical protein